MAFYPCYLKKFESRIFGTGTFYRYKKEYSVGYSIEQFGGEQSRVVSVCCHTGNKSLPEDETGGLLRYFGFDTKKHIETSMSGIRPLAIPIIMYSLFLEANVHLL